MTDSGKPAPDNLRHWSALEKTDPTATKPFSRAGGFKGTATKPIYHEKKLTEHFGPCGMGWGMEKPEFQLVTAGDEILVFCTVALWYIDVRESQKVWGIGGDKVVARRGDGAFANDEAFKAAFTDALGNAMKHIGVGADVHMGEFDKYGRDEPTQRTAPAPAQQRTAPVPSSPVTNGTGQQTAPAEHPKRPQALEAWKRIHDALERADTLKRVDDIVTANGVGLAIVKEVSPTTYDDLMKFANARKTEFYGATG